MSTLFSVNLNKLALIRNSRGTDYPNLLTFVKKLIDLGIKGFTVHPRPDERHIRYQDVYDISAFLKDYPEIEFNIEGNPNEQFLKIIREVKPHQCTLVPDSDDQLTSDHGFDIITHHEFLSTLSKELEAFGTRCAVFIDPDIEQIKAVIESDVQTIEMYTEEWARAYSNGKSDDNIDFDEVKQRFSDCINLANQNGIRVNAGHDLNLDNLADLLALSDIAEVSIGHAFTIESLEQGMDNVVRQYLAICG
ncbi:pyridoxine 5'-phosphate synthase [Psychrobacter sp. SCQQ22]|uniref:pyridoxine 5'-phosphate synthase n=1 Tax=Psychrobacter sp. SCQQ22 TaxID=2792059 RepID=UPI0018CE9C9F|nr:pyridoxine 5'-phosphate synthase [Psychrobacter sp. SCQQ22]MBH0084913.1 pyridoxine 5'-phosphate synthase [Psychrobacter sp. SCQQ22]